MKPTLVVLFLTIALGTTFASSTTSELVISNFGGSQSCTITDVGGSANYAGDACSGLTGRVTVGPTSLTIVNGTFTTGGTNLWQINVVDGISNSPATDPGLDVTSETAFCQVGCGSGAELQIYFSDINFTTPATGFVNNYSASDEGNGNTSQEAWVSTTNTLLAETSAIGTVGPFSGTGGAGTVSGGGTVGPSPYSLTLEQIFNAPTDNTDTFSVDGSITANVNVPEPMSLLLLGGCLLVVGRKLAARLA